jgi:hypothetical protein
MKHSLWGSSSINRSRRFAYIGFGLSGVALLASCGSAQTPVPVSIPTHQPVNMLCYSDETQDVVRLSGVFLLKNPQDFSEPWRLDFRRYLGQSGNEGAVLVTCSPVSSSDPQGALKAHAGALRQKNKRVVETGWTYAN